MTASGSREPEVGVLLPSSFILSKKLLAPPSGKACGRGAGGSSWDLVGFLGGNFQAGRRTMRPCARSRLPVKPMVVSPNAARDGQRAHNVARVATGAQADEHVAGPAVDIDLLGEDHLAAGVVVDGAGERRVAGQGDGRDAAPGASAASSRRSSSVPPAPACSRGRRARGGFCGPGRSLWPVRRRCVRCPRRCRRCRRRAPCPPARWQAQTAAAARDHFAGERLQRRATQEHVVDVTQGVGTQRRARRSHGGKMRR